MDGAIDRSLPDPSKSSTPDLYAWSSSMALASCPWSELSQSAPFVYEGTSRPCARRRGIPDSASRRRLELRECRFQHWMARRARYVFGVREPQARKLLRGAAEAGARSRAIASAARGSSAGREHPGSGAVLGTFRSSRGRLSASPFRRRRQVRHPLPQCIPQGDRRRRGARDGALRRARGSPGALHGGVRGAPTVTSRDARVGAVSGDATSHRFGASVAPPPRCSWRSDRAEQAVLLVVRAGREEERGRRAVVRCAVAELERP